MSYNCETCGYNVPSCICKMPQHPTGIPGFLTMEQAAAYVENMRDDYLESFLLELRRSLQRRSESDYKAKKYKLACALEKAAAGVGIGAFNIGDAWRVCEPHFRVPKEDE